MSSISKTTKMAKIHQHCRDHMMECVDMDAKIENERNNNLDDEWREKAANELNETNEIRKIHIKQLRHLLITSPTTTTRTETTTDKIPNGRLDDAFLLRFLRAKKFNVENAFRMIKKYYSMKERSPELFKVSPVSELHDLLKMQMQYMVSNRDSNGRKLYIFRVKNCDPYKCHVETVFRTNVLALENAVREPETQIGGLIVLLDMAGAGLGHAKFLAPHLAKKTVEVVQEAFPLRFKAFHILHEPFYFDAILAVLKPFLKEKIKRRIFLHGSNLASLHKFISPDILPTDYGGKQSKFDNTIWRETLIKDEMYFERLENFNYDYNSTIIINSLEDSDKNQKDSDEINGNHCVNKVKNVSNIEKTVQNNEVNSNVSNPVTVSCSDSIPTVKNCFSGDADSEHELCVGYPLDVINIQCTTTPRKGHQNQE